MLPKIKCFAPWAGGKRRLAPRVAELLGEHGVYAEPFVGGCAILPQKPRVASEIVNDANPRLTNVLRAMQRSGQKIIERLAAVEFSRGVFVDCLDFVDRAISPVGHCTDDELAARQLVVWWMGPNGLAGTDRKPWFAQRHTKTGGDPAVRWNSFKASLPWLCERLTGVEVTGVDGFALLDSVPDESRVAIYVDPPYFAKSFRYSVDFDEADHRRLADSLGRFRLARVVVSYYDSVGLADGGSRLDELYPLERWGRHQVSVSKASANAVRPGTTKTAAVEVLLVGRGRGDV